MKICVVISIFSLIFSFLNFFGEVNAQIAEQQKSENSVKTEQAAVVELREFYFDRDFEGGEKLGQTLVKQFPYDLEINAWFILNLARNDRSGEAVEAAKKLVENNEENAWAMFALAHAYIRNAQPQEATAFAEKALKMMPDNEEFIFLYISSLLSREKYDEIYSFLERNSSQIKDRSRLLYVKAEAQYREFSDSDEIKRKPGFETFARAKELSPNSVNANFIYGLYLNSDKRFTEAYPLLKQAVALSPNAVDIRQQFWWTIMRGQPKKTIEQRKSELNADLNDLLRRRANSPGALEAIAAFYKSDLGMPNKKKEIDRIILEKFPQTAQAERVLIEEIRTFNYVGADKKIDEKKKEQLTRLMGNFINRAKLFDENYLGLISTRYFYEVKNDQKTTDAQLLQVAENISSHQKFDSGTVYSMIISGLTERKMFREAERFAALGFEKVKEEIERERAVVKDEKPVQEKSKTMNAALYNARGSLYFKQNRFDEAEKDFLEAIERNNEYSFYYSNLAQVYEAKNEYAKAEDAYINAISTFFGKNDPNIEKLKTLYQKRNGDLKGFDKYFENIRIIERERRKTRIISAKIIDAANATPFTLNSLEDKPIALADLKGKVVVINIWATWCGPCVSEMPEFQELHNKYRNDKNVVILTINDGDNLETVKKFMTDKKYDFAVLRNEKYLKSVGVNIYPTTWFINREGKISYVKIGASDKLLEEFDWRIQELKK